MNYFIFIISLIMSSNILNAASKSPHQCNEGFLPKNNHYIPVYRKGQFAGISQAEFNSVIDKIEKTFSPIIKKYGGNLKVDRLWTDGTVNASASRMGNTYIIKMYGGLARHTTITKDAFALVACHEVGHHIGGVPRYTNQGTSWASVEGQSDYFATSKCLKKLFSGDDNLAIISTMKLDPLVIERCDSQFSNSNENSICKRISMAGLSSASLFAAMNNQNLPKFETPDSRVVNSTFESHPKYQCRLDTYFQGAICDIDANTEIGQNDPNLGTCNRSDNHILGLRPLCWYKPNSGGGGTNPRPIPGGEISKTPTVNGQTSITASNPDINIPIYFDVSNFQNVVGMAIEISKPNRIFSNPNGVNPDRVNGLGVKVYKRGSGVYNFLPRRELPGFGRYQIRVIGLDQRQNPVSKFSDSFNLLLN